MPTHFSHIVDQDLLKEMIDGGYIKVQTSPDNRFNIFNYTPKATYERVWNDATKLCRGLILRRRDGMVAARPFPKFYNLSEYPSDHEIHSRMDFRLQDKMDGSLGICYSDAHLPFLATRGSFNSDQAHKGTYLLRTRYSNFTGHKDYTFLFEIIYPGNRIVVDYQGQTDVVLLAVIKIEDGTELDLAHPDTKRWLSEHVRWMGPVVREQQYTPGQSPADCLDDYCFGDGVTEEGFVVLYDQPDGTRLRAKIKTPEYVRLHRLATNMSSKDVWEGLRDGIPLAELIADISDEHIVEWATSLRASLLAEFIELKTLAYRNFDGVMHYLREADDVKVPTPNDLARREMRETRDYRDFRSRFAQASNRTEMPSLMFSILDNESIHSALWKTIEPKFSMPYDDDEAFADLPS